MPEVTTHGGELVQAKSLLERALKIDEVSFGPTDRETAHCLDNLGLVSVSEEKLDEAQSKFERALAIREKDPGPEHPETATSLRSLARVLEAEGKAREALPLFRRALTIREKTLGRDHPETVSSRLDVEHAETVLPPAKAPAEEIRDG